MCIILLLAQFLSLGLCSNLLNFTNSLTVGNLSKLEECLLELINVYFGNSKSVLIMNYETHHNFLRKIGKPTVLINTSNQRNVRFKIYSVILFINDKTVDDIWKITSRTSHTKFIVVGNKENISIITRRFWNLKILSLLILVEKEKFVEIYTYDPFFNQNCSGLSEPKLINNWDVIKREFHTTWKDIDYNIDLMRCSLNISFMDFPPFVIRDREKTDVRKIAGIAAKLKTFDLDP